ncbi:hypothetical protein F8M41_015412 [Gigaspora margarita]|uniref:Uncharacterized protein n=1 Tax=Gigaspora margarita TaxID=4874 RepID=A0A8H3ZX81_GIGMA|nr:hypothetical protein F8M41_015412 [Gigaspora margarita]
MYLTISQRPSDIESEQLFSLLKEQKSNIDRVLNSYNVYAIGPNVQNNYSIPYIACWVAEHLRNLLWKEFWQCSIMNLKSHAIYRDDENDGDNDNDNEGDADNSGGSSGGSKSSNSGGSSGDNNENDNDNNSGDDNGSSDDNEINKKNKKMVILLEGKVEFEDEKLIKDKKQFQNFNITIELWAKVDLKNYTKNNNSLTFEFKINLIQCEVTDLLSKLCLSLNSFTGYYINSLEICVSPIPSADNTSNMIITNGRFSPCKANNDRTFTRIPSRMSRYWLTTKYEIIT